MGVNKSCALIIVTIFLECLCVPGICSAAEQSENTKQFNEAFSKAFPVEISPSELETIVRCAPNFVAKEIEKQRLTDARREKKLHDRYGGRVWLVLGMPYAFDARRKLFWDLVGEGQFRSEEGKDWAALAQEMIPEIKGQGLKKWPLLPQMETEMAIGCGKESVHLRL